MKAILTSLLFTILATTAGAQDQPLSVMTYNIRCGSCEPQDSPNHWSKRKFLVAHLIKNNNPDIIGFQEAESFQIENLADMLGEYSWVGVGRDNGASGGEANAVFFRKSRFLLENTKTIWLSPTPHQVSRGWDAAYNRTLTISTLKDLETNITWSILNTHFDNQGAVAQKNSAKMLIAELKKIPSDIPTVVTGDFNLASDNQVYKYITKSSQIVDTSPDSKTNIITFNDFGKKSPANKKIDFIFVNKSLTTLDQKIDQTRYNQLYPSDHYPIIVVLQNKPQL